MRDGGNNGQNSQNTGEPQITADFATINAMIFVPKCLSCHKPPSPGGSYDMSSYATIISGGRLVSFNPSTSKLYTMMVAGTMPPGGGLTQAELQAVSLWITNGIKNDGAPGPVVSPTPLPIPTPIPSPNQVSTFSSVFANIISPKCLSCHSNNGKSPPLTSYAQIVNIVKPLAASQSQLYTSMISGGMPPNSPLSPTELQSVADWINAGALNN
jgi:hypothetical protein